MNSNAVEKSKHQQEIRDLLNSGWSAKRILSYLKERHGDNDERDKGKPGFGVHGPMIATNTSPTFVPVGPVTIRSPRAAKNAWESLASRRRVLHRTTN